MGAGTISDQHSHHNHQLILSKIPSSCPPLLIPSPLCLLPSLHLPPPHLLPLLIPSPWSLLPAGGTWDYIRQDAPRGVTDLLQGEYGFVSKLKGFVTCGYWIYFTISLWIYWFNTYFKWWSFDDSGIQSQVVRSVSKQIYVIPLRGFGGFVRSDTLDLSGGRSDIYRWLIRDPRHLPEVLPMQFDTIFSPIIFQFIWDRSMANFRFH